MILIFLADRAPWDERTCAQAARGGHLEVLKWLRDPNIPGGPCPWNIMTFVFADIMVIWKY